MKKICILLALILALACFPAFAAEGDAILGLSNESTLSFNYCFSIGDTLYLVSYGNLYTYHVGDSDLKAYSIAVPEDQFVGMSSFEYAALPFAADGKLYALSLVTEYGEDTEFKGAYITELTLNDSGDAASTVVCEVDWSDMVEFYDNSSYPIQPDIIIGGQGTAFARYFDNMGDYKTVGIDLATGLTLEIDELTGAYTIAPYKDGKMLAMMYDGEVDTSAQLVSYDPANLSADMLCEIAVENYNTPLGLAYDGQSDTVYCVMSGEICPIDLQNGTIGEGVTEMPLEAYSGAPGCILDGGYYAYCGEGATIRNLDPKQKAQTKLRVNDSFWSDSVNSAYYKFANTHGDVSVVLSREYSEVENLIENMMNRDDRVDIYVLATSNSVYEALFNRGYLMELDGNEKVKALADSMYPSIREKLSTNGHLVALPLSAFSWSVGINEQALAKLGMKIEDVPDNWSDFLDFLAGLEGKLNAENGVHLLYSGYTDADVRYELMNMILMDYQYYVNDTNPDMGYNNPLVHKLLEKLEKIDFTALGCPSDMDDQTYNLDAYDEESVLMTSSTGCNIGNFYSMFTPVLMHMTKDASSYLVLDTTVLVVNPFTKNADAALAFAGEVVDNLTTQTRYSIIPDLNDPIRGDQNQAALNELKEELESMRSEYESAPADEKQSLELDIQEEEKTLAYAEANNWDVSPTELEWYRAHDDNIIVSIYNWLYPDTTSDEEDGGITQAAEAEELMDQYLNGQISLDDMLSGIDRKVQMRRLEGN